MNDNKRPLFTIFTATFNRKNLITRAYESVKKQTFRDFEWLVVDDGSTDGTGELIKQWQAEADFPIIYYWQPNQGKHIAYNTAARIMQGSLFIILDSDDEIMPETLERFRHRWNGLPENKEENIAGIMCLCVDQDGQPIGDPFKKDGQLEDFMKVLLVDRVKGEKGGILQASVFKQYRFPDEVKNTYVPEEIFIHRMARDWKTFCINEPLRTYWIDKRSDHLGQQMISEKNLPGDRLLHLAYLNYSMRLFWRRPRIFIINTILFAALSFRIKKGVGTQWKEVRNIFGKILWLSLLPAGYIYYAMKLKK